MPAPSRFSYYSALAPISGGTTDTDMGIHSMCVLSGSQSDIVSPADCQVFPNGGSSAGTNWVLESVLTNGNANHWCIATCMD